MIYLFLAVICSSSIVLILKFSESRNLNRLAVTTANYVVAFLTSFFFVISGGLHKTEFTEFKLFPELASSFKTGILLSESSSFLWALFLGFFGGILYFGGFIFIQKSIRDNGAGITGAVSKIGIFIPMTFSIVLWKEYPSAIQWIGIILAMGAIILASYTPSQTKELKNLRKSLIFVFFVVGLAEFSNKFFQKHALIEFKSLFLFTVFFTAFIISIIFTLLDKKKFSKQDILTGFLVGIPNMFTSFFLISALKYVKTTIAFPVYSAGSIIVINIGSYLFFKEKLSKKDLYATGIIIIAISLMSFQ